MPSRSAMDLTAHSEFCQMSRQSGLKFAKEVSISSKVCLGLRGMAIAEQETESIANAA